MTLLNRQQVAKILGVSPNTFDQRFRHVSDFPKPVNNGGHPKWREADILEWLAGGRRAA